MATSIFNPKALEANEGYISKIQLGEKLYYITDKEARDLLALLGTAAKKDVSTETGIKSDDAGLVTGAQVAEAIGNISSAMHFIGVSTTEPTIANGKGVATIGGETITAADGDIVLYGVKEYVYGNLKWNELGDEGLYALKSFTIGSQDLDGTFSLDTLKSDLGLKALAYADSAKGTVAGQTITGVTATGTPAGSVTVTLEQTATAATLTKGDYTPAGTVSKPDITVTPTDTTVTGIDSVGTKSTFSQGTKAAWEAKVTDETLSFVFTANGDDTFTAGDLPTKAAAATVLTAVSAELAAAPAFEGTKATEILVTGVSYDKATVDADNTTFAGSEMTATVGDITVAAKDVTVTPVVTGA